MSGSISCRDLRLAAIAALIPLAAIATWVLPAPARGGCYDYPDTHIQFFSGQPVCAGWGIWCIECVAGGASCFGDLEGNAECIMHDVP